MQQTFRGWTCRRKWSYFAQNIFISFCKIQSTFQKAWTILNSTCNVHWILWKENNTWRIPLSAQFAVHVHSCTVVKPDQSTSLKNGLMYNQEKPAALVLQVNSHERDGVTSCQKICQNAPPLPIVSIYTIYNAYFVFWLWVIMHPHLT